MGRSLVDIVLKRKCSPWTNWIQSKAKGEKRVWNQKSSPHYPLCQVQFLGFFFQLSGNILEKIGHKVQKKGGGQTQTKKQYSCITHCSFSFKKKTHNFFAARQKTKQTNKQAKNILHSIFAKYMWDKLWFFWLISELLLPQWGSF